MGWFSKRSLFAAVAAVAIGFGAQVASAAYTTVYAPGPNPATSPDLDHREIFDAWAIRLGLATSDSFTGTVTPTVANYTSISATGVWTATRINDSPFVAPGAGTPPTNTLNIGLGPNPAGTADQVWSDGTADLTLKAKYSGAAHLFGLRPLDLAGNVIGPSVQIAKATNTEFNDPLDPGDPGNVLGDLRGTALDNKVINAPDIFEFYRTDPSGNNAWYSRESANSDGLDHMVTYRVTGLFASGNAAYAVFFEDLSGPYNPPGAGGSVADRDFNDVGFLFEVTNPDFGPNPVPLPATAWATMASLAGLGLTRLSRRLTR